MACLKCGLEIDPSYLYCPNCGKAQFSEPSTQTKRRMPFWFKLVTFLAVIALIGVTAGILFTESLVDVIDNQLQALKNKEIKQAYEKYTSSEFQAAISLNQFENFIDAYPVFFNNQSAHFAQRCIDHNIATLKGYLTSVDHHQIPIEYKLIKEGSKWKILNLRLLKPEEIPHSKGIEGSIPLIDTVKNQLKLIQDKQFKESYDRYLSNEFKKATSEKSYIKFIHDHSFLMDYQVISFHQPIIRNGIGHLSIILQASQKAFYLKYYLIFENHQWKIWSMRVLFPFDSETD